MTSGRRRVVVGTIVVFGTLLVGVQVETFLLRRSVSHLVEEHTDAVAHLAATTRSISTTEARVATVDDQVDRAREDLDRVTALLEGAGIDRRSLRSTERETSEWLDGIEQLRTSTQRRGDDLAVQVRDATRCVEDGLKSLTNAAPGGFPASNDTSCPVRSSGDEASEAPTAR